MTKNTITDYTFSCPGTLMPCRRPTGHDLSEDVTPKRPFQQPRVPTAHRVAEAMPGSMPHDWLPKTKMTRVERTCSRIMLQENSESHWKPQLLLFRTSDMFASGGLQCNFD